jgi:hypothetical protein
VPLPDGFIDMPVHEFVDRLAIGAEGEDDLAGRFRAVGWPVCQLGRAEAGAQHAPLWVGDREVKLPDMMVRIPSFGWAFIECRMKRKGVIYGLDAYGLNVGRQGRTDRWEELLVADEHARNVILAVFDPAFGWLLVRVAKLAAIGLTTDKGEQWWLVPRRHMTPLSQVLDGVLRPGLLLSGMEA